MNNVSKQEEIYTVATSIKNNKEKKMVFNRDDKKQKMHIRRKI